MHKIALFAFILAAIPARATYWDSVTIPAIYASHASAESAAGGLDSDQLARAAILPMRMVTSGGGNDSATYILVYQPQTSESGTCLPSGSETSLPAESWTIGTCTRTVNGWTMANYSTRAAAVTGYGNLDSHLQPFAIGPLRTLSSSYPWVLVYPTNSLACQ